MLTVRFEDNREAFKSLLLRKLSAATRAAAGVLAEEYKEILSDPAPPHSRPGQIPHAYYGHKEGGYGPVNGLYEPNNTPAQGFASTQVDFLKEYLDSSGERDGSAVVGFAPSHVTTREQNYLLGWDQGRIEGTTVRERPWVMPGYQMAMEKMREFAAEQFRTVR